MLVCSFCGATHFQTSNSLKNHECRCKGNPDRIVTAVGNRKGVPSWNSGLTGDPRCKISESNAENLRSVALSRTPEWHKENGKRISATVNKKVEDGLWHTSLVRNMHIEYNGVDLHGSWELAYAKYLDSQLIKWVRNKDSFSYSYNGKTRRYTPDFYLIDSDEYVEIKGYKTEKDEAKWSQFPTHRKLTILMKKELQELSLI